MDVGVSDQDVDMISMMLYVKDKYNVSGTAYHEMASRHYRLKQRISELNSKWNIRPHTRRDTWSSTAAAGQLVSF